MSGREGSGAVVGPYIHRVGTKAQIAVKGCRGLLRETTIVSSVLDAWSFGCSQKLSRFRLTLS